MQHDRHYRGLDAVEQPGDDRLLPPRHVDPRQRDQQHERRQHEEHARGDAAARLVQQPSEVGRELLRLRTRQHHAVVQCMQETPLADPAPSLDQLGVHDRDLPRRPAEADEAELEPEAQRFGEADGCGGLIGHRLHDNRRGATST
jgi:hypothetical protein